MISDDEIKKGMYCAQCGETVHSRKEAELHGLINPPMTSNKVMMRELANGNIADAIEKCDWSNASIGNKEILKAAVVALRRPSPDPARVAEALQRALNATGCDGDLCSHQWHEDARQALAGAGEVDGWRPIETAPKDGTLVILWVHSMLMKGPLVARWDQSDGFEDEQREWCAMIPGLGLADLREYTVTHWMPILPETPV